MAELVVLGAVSESEARIAEASRGLDRTQRKLSSLQGIGEAGLVAASSLAVWAATHPPRYLSGPKMIFFPSGTEFTTWSAFAEVQQMSVSAFTSAVELT